MDANAAAARYEDAVRPEWIDNNDHMNLAYYVLVFTAATDAFGRQLGLSGPFRVTQMHTVYEREVALGDQLSVATHVLDADGVGLHLFHEMFQVKQGYLAATLELSVEHAGEVRPETRARIAALVAGEIPAGAGRRIGMTARR